MIALIVFLVVVTAFQNALILVFAGRNYFATKQAIYLAILFAYGLYALQTIGQLMQFSFRLRPAGLLLSVKLGPIYPFLFYGIMIIGILASMRKKWWISAQ